MNTEQILAYYDCIADAPDAIPLLRRFILDLAVRGKLVPQDPKDETALELIKCIAAEKAQLLKIGKIRDRLSLPTVSIEEQPFPLPTSWLWVRFANIADFSAGKTPSRNDPSLWDNGDYAWVSIADMSDGEVLQTTKERITERARDKVFGYEPEPVGTLIMSFKLTIGKIARLGIPAFHNEAIITIRPHLTNMDPYLFIFLPQFAQRGNTKGAIKGATLNRDSLSNILLPLPPLAEQYRIVARVNELMVLCDRLEASREDREAVRDHLAAASLTRLNHPDPDLQVFQKHAAFTLENMASITTRPDQIVTLRQTIFRSCQTIR